jgi:hypothetical protein
MTGSDIDVEAETDRLYQLPPAEFVAARNALAARLKSSGDKDGAARVRALARPSVAAWAANQAYSTARSAFDALIERTRRLQSAQTGEGAGLREAMNERREALATVVARAQFVLVAAGLDSSPDTLRRVSNTFEALAARTDGQTPHPGRLVRDLDPPGFDALTATTPAPSEPPREIANEPRSVSVERARAELAEAETRLERASQDARDAATAQSIAAKNAADAEEQLAALARRLEEAKQKAEHAASQATAARTKAELRAHARDHAEAARNAALGRLRDLD